MQGQRSEFGSFTETVDLNQESLSNSSNMDHPTGWNNVLNPVESRLPHNGRSFSGWDLGESSSSANVQDQIPGDGLRVEEHGWSSSYSACPASETRLEDNPFEESSIFLCGRGSNGPETRLDEHRSNFFMRGRVGNGLGSNDATWGHLSMQNSGSDLFPVNVNLNARYTDDSGQGIGAGIFPSFYKPGRLDSEHIPSTSMSSANVGTSSGNSGYFLDNDDESGSSLGCWGLSCKRKALEGTSAHPYPGGSASFFQQAENYVPQNILARHNASSSLSISSPPLNSPTVARSDLNSRFGVGMRGAASDVFPPASVTGTAENSSGNLGGHVNLGHHESVPFNLLAAGNTARRSDGRSSHRSYRSISIVDSLEFSPTAYLPSNSSNHLNQPHLMHGPIPGPGLTRNMPPTWNDTRHSRTGSSSSSLMASRERGAGLHEEASFRRATRNSVNHPVFVPATETRNLVEDPTDWNLGTGGNSSSPGGLASSSQVGSSSSSRTFPTSWHHNSSTQNRPRLSDFAPWTLFPSGDSEAGSSRGHFYTHVSGTSSSAEDPIITSGSNSQGHRRTYPRSALLMEVPGDDIGGWHSLAADIDGRQRLVFEIHHVLNAMRRGENLRAEDYMLFDPYINGVAELHDRHRDMRLDVDNMSYEELLALEERIGNVNTGLTEENILQSMKQREHLPFMIGAPTKLEPCCICQEEYVMGETIGTLDCGHDFHSSCVKQWLLQKNLCPICKMTGLGT